MMIDKTDKSGAFMKSYSEIKKLFLKANRLFLSEEKALLNSSVSERCLCASLMCHIDRLMRQDDSYKGYHVDVEYNRNGGRIKTVKKTVMGPESKPISVTCDLIIHSRGAIPAQDNLLALEMKKSTANPSDKESDKDRLMALTKDSFDDVWSFDGKTLPEHVCRYVIGIFYEINYRRRTISLEYFKGGEILDEAELIRF